MALETQLAPEDPVASALQAAGLSTPANLDAAARRQAAIAAVARRSPDESDDRELLRDAAALIAETLDVDHCGVADRLLGGARIAFWLSDTASVGEPGSGIETEYGAGQAISLVGHAMAYGRPVVVADLAQEKRFNDPFLKRLQIQSAIVSPLGSDKPSSGVIGVFSTAQRSFTWEDVLFVDSISALTTATLARRRAESALATQKRAADTILNTVEALVIELSVEGRIIDLNRASERVTGFTARELKDRPVWNALLITDEVERVQQCFEQLRETRAAIDFRSYILTKQGSRRRIAWSFAPVIDESGRIDALIGTGLDVTPQELLEEKLERNQAMADEAKRSLNELMERIEKIGIRDSDGRPFQPIPSGDFGERRRRPRRAYPYLQMMAPYIDNKLPPREAFIEVRCKDIAAGGFSFVTSTKPQYRHYVVAFGAAPNLMHLAAEVVHCDAIEVDGQAAFLAGCRYTGRVEYP